MRYPLQLATLQAALADRYVIQHEVGQGAMGTVYVAKDPRLKRKVAIKVLTPAISALSSQRFLREIEITAQLNHPHILPVHDCGKVDDWLYYVMPYVEGESLRARLDHQKQLPIDDAVSIARQVADALGYAHSRGFVHRDIKPDNILLVEGHAVVADFGLARALSLSAREQLTQAGIGVGSPAYMSPEQATGEGELDGRTDIYALGCVLYEMLAGVVPFSAANSTAALTRKLVERAAPVGLLRDTVPEAVERAVARALARAPADRFPSAHEFLKALGEPTIPGGVVSKPARRPRRFRFKFELEVVLSAIAVALPALLALVVLLLVQGQPKAGQSVQPTLRAQTLAESVRVVGDPSIDQLITFAAATSVGTPVNNLPPPPASSSTRNDVLRAPTFTPFTTMPRLLNPDEVQRALEHNYPIPLREAGIGGQVLVWILVDETGKLLRIELNEGSGHAVLDEAAIRVAEIMKYSAALNHEKRVPVWVSVPIVFRAVPK